jgi:carbon storage regulator
MIGDDVVVTVLAVSGQTVRLGIAGPASVPIYREEVWLAVRAENQAAAQSQAEGLPADLLKERR